MTSQGTLLTVHVCAANKADGAEAGSAMGAGRRTSSVVAKLHGGTAYKRQAEHVAREQLGVEWPVRFFG